MAVKVKFQDLAPCSEDVEVICPDIEDLTQVETNITCPVDGCAKILPNSSALRMHLLKTHKEREEENSVFDRGVVNKPKKNIVFCCPVETCVRGRNSARYFHRLAHVKQHYMNIHGEKKFICKKCEKKFGRNDVCLRHEKTCGMVFSCSCGVEFNSRTSMLTHAKRNGHIVPSSNERNETHLKQINRKLPRGVSNQAILLSLVQDDNRSVSKPLRPLRPKKIFSDAETQTEQPCSHQSKGSTLILNEASSSVNESLLTHGEISFTQVGQSYPVNEGTSSMENNECSVNKESLLQKDKGVTVNIQLERPDMNVSCKHTQTVEYVPAEFEDNFDVEFIDNEDFKGLAHSQTQTNWGLTFDNFPLFEDNETQTLESYLELDQSTIDCATQTILDEMFSVDNETQTRLPSINFDDEFGNMHCGNSMDGQTQTLPRSNFTPADPETLGILNASNNSSIDSQTQTQPWRKFGTSLHILQGLPSVDGQTQTLPYFMDSDSAVEILQASANTSMNNQTQTLPWTNFTDSEATFDVLQASTSNVQTQTVPKYN